MRRRSAPEQGQMTIEFVVALPAMLVVAVIAVNACTFFGLCAAFDNSFRDAVRVCATSPAYGQDVAQSCTLVEEQLADVAHAQNVEVEVTARAVSQGHTTFSGLLRFRPALFSFALKSEIFGVALPALTHTEEMTVDCYKPGVLL